MPDIMHQVRIQATPERVYQALTLPAEIRQWWTRDAELDATVGGKGEFAFSDRKVRTTVRIDDLKADARVAWKTTASNAPGGWNGTMIEFDLRADERATVLSFAHRGFAAADDGYARVTAGWGHYLLSLQQYLETGKGMPA